MAPGIEHRRAAATHQRLALRDVDRRAPPGARLGSRALSRRVSPADLQPAGTDRPVASQWAEPPRRARDASARCRIRGQLVARLGRTNHSPNTSDTDPRRRGPLMPTLLVATTG